MIMREKSPTVSVIIPTYNRAHLIGRAIQSVLNQTYQDFELFVVDDGSTDNTEEVIKSFRDERIRYIRHEKNKGGSAARNTGIKAARGKYIAFQDSDDEWLKDKLEKQVKAMRNLDPGVWGGMYCGFYAIINKRIVVIRATKKGNLKKELLSKKLNIGASSTLLFSREAIEEIGFFDENFERHQDWEYLIRFFRRYKLFAIEQPLVNVYYGQEPAVEKMVTVKEKYLSKFKGDIYEFGDRKAKEIFALHWLEVCNLFAREGKVRKCI